MPVNADDFRNALSRFPSGVNVVTTKDADGRPHGITVSAFCSVSLTPPLVLICIEKTTPSHDAFSASEVFVVNMLRDTQQHLSEQFSVPAVDKFEDVDFRAGLGGVPVLKKALANIECRVRNAYDGGDHTIYVGEIETITVNDGAPLVYHQGDYRKLES